MMTLFPVISLVIIVHQFLMLQLVVHSMIILSNLFHGLFQSIKSLSLEKYPFLFRFDNEYGYSHRVVDLIKHMTKKDYQK